MKALQLHLCGISHATAGVEVRERFAVEPARLIEVLRRFARGGLSDQILLLSTCNRTELYAFGEGPEFAAALRRAFRSLDRRGGLGETGHTGAASAAHSNGASPGAAGAAHSNGAPPGAAGAARSNGARPGGTDGGLAIREAHGREAVRHLLAVVSGLDSLILGETQIKQQVRVAYEASREAGTAGADLHRLVQTANRVSKRVRTGTSLNLGTLDVGRAAVLQAEQELGSLAGKVCLVIGAGKIGRIAVRELASRRPARLVIVNRTLDRAMEAGGELGAEAAGLETLPGLLSKADLVLGAAHAPEFLVTRQAFEQARRGAGGDARATCVLIDAAVPRILDPEIGLLPGVRLFDIEHMTGIIEENRRRRHTAAAEAWRIIDGELTGETAVRLIASPRGTTACARGTRRPGGTVRTPGRQPRPARPGSRS